MFSAPYLTYLMWLRIWDGPHNFLVTRIWRIWRIYVFEISPQKTVCHVFNVFMCLRIWDFSTKKSGPVFGVFMYLKFFSKKLCATYLTYSRVYVFKIFQKKDFAPYLTCLCIWDYSPKNCVSRIWRIHVFTYLRFLKKNWPRIWRVYVFESFSPKIVCHVFDVFTCLRIWDLSKKK